jgi:hypothetical protein
VEFTEVVRKRRMVHAFEPSTPASAGGSAGVAFGEDARRRELGVPATAS